VLAMIVSWGVRHTRSARVLVPRAFGVVYVYHCSESLFHCALTSEDWHSSMLHLR
jgi:hypothetical protein